MKTLTALMMTFMLVSTAHAETFSDADFDSLSNELQLDQEVTVTSADATAPYSTDDSKIVKITGTSIKLLGRGLQNRKTGENVALACITENCSQLRTAYFTPDGKNAYLFGSPIRITDGADPTRQQIKTTLKRLVKGIKSEKRNRQERFYSKFGTGVGAAGMFSMLFVGTATGAIVVCGGAAVLVYALIGINELAFGTQQAVASFDQTQGWNWSSHPKKISSKNFEYLIRYRTPGVVEYIDYRRTDIHYNINHYRPKASSEE